MPGAENAGKPGYYTVKPGDTLVRIALETGQNWRDIARWNNMDNPNVLEVGQVLRVEEPQEAVVARPLPPASTPPVLTSRWRCTPSSTAWTRVSRSFSTL